MLVGLEVNAEIGHEKELLIDPRPGEVLGGHLARLKPQTCRYIEATGAVLQVERPSIGIEFAGKFRGELRVE